MICTKLLLLLYVLFMNCKNIPAKIFKKIFLDETVRAARIYHECAIVSFRVPQLTRPE